LKGLLNKFKNLQYKEEDKLTFTNIIKHLLGSTHNCPIYSKPYPLVQMHLDKCEFLKTEVGFLGHIVNSDGIKPTPLKVKPQFHTRFRQK